MKSTTFHGKGKTRLLHRWRIKLRQEKRLLERITIDDDALNYHQGRYDGILMCIHALERFEDTSI